jgi:hypothetical protein
MTLTNHSPLVTVSLKALTDKLIDYAGLFPPANLSLAEAVTLYDRYRREPESWMLSRFIIPAQRLAELTALAGDRFQPDSPYHFSILGQGGQDATGFLDGLKADLAEVAAFRQAHGSGITADIFETRLPDSILAEADVMEINGLLAGAGTLLAGQGLHPFYEAALGPSWRSVVDVSVKAIAAYNGAAGQGASLPEAGFKLRCGGTDAAAFPSQYQVAHAIAVCRDSGVLMKCTAGLHHPIRRYDESVQNKMHGFVNVFAAGILAHIYNLPEHEIAAIIADENPAHFIFDEKKFAWLDRIASPAKIQLARQELMASFGSCSVDEPREDLQALDWLANTDFMM